MAAGLWKSPVAPFDQLVVGEGEGPGDVTGADRSRFAHEQVAGAGVHDDGPAVHRVRQGLEIETQPRRPCGKGATGGVRPAVGHAAAVLRPGPPAAVEDPGVHLVAAQCPGDPGRVDAVVVVVGDHEVIGSDPQAAGVCGEPLGSSQLEGDVPGLLHEVAGPIDEDGPRDVGALELGPLGVRQGRARVAAAHVEHAQPRVVEVGVEPVAVDERAARRCHRG